MSKRNESTTTEIVEVADGDVDVAIDGDSDLEVIESDDVVTDDPAEERVVDTEETDETAADDGEKATVPRVMVDPRGPRFGAAITVVFMSFALVGLATGLGARYPRFAADNPSQVAGSAPMGVVAEKLRYRSRPMWIFTRMRAGRERRKIGTIPATRQMRPLGEHPRRPVGSLRSMPRLPLIGLLLIAGIALFSGSLYLIALSGVSRLGMVTPCGGTAFIAAWIWLAWQLHRAKA